MMMMITITDVDEIATHESVLVVDRRIGFIVEAHHRFIC